MKCTYYIHDSIGMIGAQIAGTKQRAIMLFAAKHPEVTMDRVGDLVAYDAANDQVPSGFVPDNGLERVS